MKWFLYCLAGLLLLLCIPVMGPYIGLAGYQDAAEPRGVTVRIANGDLNVYQAGAGAQTVVLVHGQPGSAQWMADLAAALNSRGFRTVRYDRMGWGYSGQRDASSPANPSQHARDLLQLMDTLHLQDVLVVGYSYGGGVALEAARLAPGRVTKLVTIASVGKPERRGQQGMVGQVMLTPAVLRWNLGTTLTAEMGGEPLFQMLAAPQDLSQIQIHTLLATLALPGAPSGWQREREQRYLHFDGYQPAAVSACTLVIHGDGDRLVAPDTAQYLSAEMPDATRWLIPNAGHALIFTHAEAIAARIAQHAQACHTP